MKTLIFSIAVLTATAAAAEESTPMPSAAENPAYPVELQRKGIEGWGLLSVRVTRAGAVEDAFVVDSSGRETVERSLLTSVKRWRFHPASFERCGVKLRLQLTLEGAKVRASADRRTKRFEAALARGDLVAAKAEIEEFDPHSLKEVAMRDQMRGRLAHVEGDVAGEIISLRRAASGVSIQNSNAEGRAWATTMRTAELLALVVARQYGEAATLMRSLRADGVLAPEIEPAAAQLDALPTSSGRMETPAVLRRLAASADAPSHWIAPLTRKRFRLDAVSGEIERAELCRNNASLDFEPQVDVQVPADAGACSVQIRGTEGTRFTLVEPPASDSAPSE
jgi:TonB family protein